MSPAALAFLDLILSKLHYCSADRAAIAALFLAMTMPSTEEIAAYNRRMDVETSLRLSGHHGRLITPTDVRAAIQRTWTRSRRSRLLDELFNRMALGEPPIDRFRFEAIKQAGLLLVADEVDANDGPVRN